MQGATLERIVIDLTRYDVPPYATFEMILVALSRARTGDGIRFIGCKCLNLLVCKLRCMLKRVQPLMMWPGCSGSR